MMTLQELVQNHHARWVRCPACQQVFQVKAHIPGGDGQWQRGPYGAWWHWHGGYPGRWEPCEVVRDGQRGI